MEVKLRKQGKMNLLNLTQKQQPSTILSSEFLGETFDLEDGPSNKHRF